jgi:hypothetical protein
VKNRLPTVWELPPDPLGGASGARPFYVLAVGKANSPKFPYTVPNEKIAAELGRAIGLRIPEVLLYESKGEWLTFSRMIEQTDSGEIMPEGTAAEIAQFFEKNPFELQGMICFDLYICNNDRNAGNFVLGRDGKVRFIDHANALYYRPTDASSAGIPRLESVEADLRSLFDKPYHFVDALTSWKYIDEWCRRISSIPSYFIRSIIDGLPAPLLSEHEREFLFHFLERRKAAMRSIIYDSRSMFPSLGEPKPEANDD